MKGVSTVLLTCMLLSLVWAGSALAADAPVEVILAHPWGGQSGEALQKVVEAFNSSQNRIHVKLLFAPYSNISQEKVLLMMASGSPPDIVMLADLLIAEYALSGTVMPLHQLFERDEVSATDYWPAAWEVTSFQGQHWAVPYTLDSRALYYNKDMFEAAGLDSQTGPKTISQLDAYAKKLTKTDAQGAIEQLGFVPWYDEGWFYTWGWLFGGEFYDRETGKITADHQRNIKAMEWIASYADRYPPEAIAGRHFTNQTCATFTAGNWNLTQVNDLGINYGVCPLPPPEGHPLSTWSGIWTLAIPADAPHPEEAWEFVKYAFGEEGQTILARTGAQLPVHAGAARGVLGYLEDMISPYIKVFVDLLPYTHYRPTIPVGSLYWNQLVEARNKVVNGEVPPDQALQEVTRLVQAALDEAMGK